MTHSLQLWLTLGIFGLTFAGIFVEIVDKGILATAGAFLCLALGLMTEREAGGFIDFETLSLLLGMMGVVSVASMAGLFEVSSVRILKLTGGSPLLIFLIFMLSTLLLSSFLNNVTTILILLPLTIQITRGIGLNPKPFVLGEIFFANIGGLLTLIGDPVNTIVGSASHLGMLDFIANMAVPVFLHFAVILVFLYATNRRQFRGIGKNFIKVLHNQLVLRSIGDALLAKEYRKSFMAKAALTLLATIVAMLFADRIGWTPGAIALTGAVLAMLLNHRDVDVLNVFHEVEWTTLFFYTGLFVLVGAVEKTGILEVAAHQLQSAAGNPYLLLGMLLLITGVVSAFVDNIPFVTVMIPVVRSLQGGGMFPHHPEILWWALSLGAVMGGMASPFGSSANIVAIGVAERAGFKISTPFYLRTSLMVSACGLVIAYLYLITAYVF